MSGKIFGYVRVSKYSQNTNLQVDALKKNGCTDDDIIQEKASGKNVERPELLRMLDKLREGDTVMVWKLDRISRSTKHLLELMEVFQNRGVNFVSLQDKIDTSSAMGKFYFTLIAAVSQMEADMISERTKSGLESARARGRKGGRKPVSPVKVKNALELYDTKKYSLAEIEEMTGIKKPTLYSYLKKRKESSGTNDTN